MRAIAAASAAVTMLGCDPATVTAPTPDYRPEEAGTVDHALCLLGFTAIPLRRTATTGHHLVEAKLNGRDALFIVDTGANVSVVEDDHAAAFGLRGGTPGGAVLVGGAGGARQVRIESLSLGGVPVRQQRIVIADLGQLAGALEPLAGGAVHGLLGQDVLNEHRAVIDMDRPLLYLIEEDRDPAPVPAERCRAASEEPQANRSGSS
ncbi:MAG: retroviral-like aspartic protease family protein [Pseudomonadota bacterium]|nr:retroviral-like aspartic protease family protein [Pseudomonadota bacterium]